MCAQRFCFRQYRQRTVFVLYTVGVLKNTGHDTLRRRQRKLALIISPAADKILHRLLNEGNLGCTVIKARTGYTGEDRDLILCAVRKRRITDVRRIASETDEKAFVLVGDVSEIIGEGFRLSDEYF